MNKIKVGLATLVALGSFAGCSQMNALIPGHRAPSPTVKPKNAQPETFAINGTIEVSDYHPELGEDGASCTSGEGYDDISEGAQATLTDQDGTILDVAQLDGGIVTSGNCSFAFAFFGVPEGKKFYSVAIGNQNRGKITYSRDQLNQPITMTLGS